MKRYEITMPGIPPAEVRGNYRGHKRYTGPIVRRLKHDAYMLAIGDWTANGKPLFEKCKVTWTFYNNRYVDLGNLHTGTKAWLDGYVEANLIQDDSPRYVVEETTRFVKCKPNEQRTEVVIEEVS